MVHFLTTKNNERIIQCNVMDNDLNSYVHLDVFSDILFSNTIITSPLNEKHFSTDISMLNNIRGRWWEFEDKLGGWKSIDHFVEYNYKCIAKIWNLNYLTD